MMINEQEMTLTLTRAQMCDISLALCLLDIETPEDNKKWGKLRDKVREQINDFDEIFKIYYDPNTDWLCL